LSRGLEDIDRTEDIAAGVEQRIGDRGSQIHLRGKMKDDVGIAAHNDTAHFGRLNIALNEREPTPIESVPAASVIKVRQDARAQVVNADDLVALGQQSVDQRGTNESGGAGDECAHCGYLLVLEAGSAVSKRPGARGPRAGS
jgi:hypothetical protein